MSQLAGNPYEPPSPAAELPIGLVPEGADRVTSVTFRYSEDDLRRASTKAVRPWLIAAILTFAWRGMRPRNWWLTERARTSARTGILVFLGLLVLLAAIIYVTGAGSV